MSHGSRLWPCGSYRRRGEIVEAGSLGMVRPRGSSPSVLSRPGGEVEFPNVPRGTTPQQDLGPRPGIAPKNLRMRISDRADAGLRCYACAKVACLRWGAICLGVGLGSLPPACGAHSQIARSVK